ASKELPALQKLADRYSSRGVQVYWVSINSSKPGARNYASDADLQAFAQKHNLKVPVLRDPDQTVYKSFGLDAVPTVVIIDQQGNQAHIHGGCGADQGEAYGELIRVIERQLKWASKQKLRSVTIFHIPYDIWNMKYGMLTPSQTFFLTAYPPAKIMSTRRLTSRR